MSDSTTNIRRVVVIVIALLCGWFEFVTHGQSSDAPTAALPARIDFNRDIKPILSDKCFACHGSDATAKKIRLRLDSEAAAKADLGGRRAIVAGKPDESELVRRINSTDKFEQMPPPASGRSLTERERQLLTEWIRQGAQWQQHWAFIAPTRPALPEVKNKAWVKNAIDTFVLARLEQESLSPSPEADRATLLRRVSLDLTGLPPTSAEIDEFINDQSPNAYEKVVDRLLASSRYGERMAFRWLDAARYADTNGYQIDGDRSAWRWRDWVIESFNRNKPYDEFIIEQLAGDLLPNATLDQRIATAFNRNHRINAEGGIVPEEYRNEYVVDRVDTTATVMMGLTMGCARCHNHKYDPLTQKEFYQFAAYFNSIDEDGHAFDQGNSPPLMAVPTRQQQERLRQFDTDIEQAQRRYDQFVKQTATLQQRWEQSLRKTSSQKTHWFPDEKLIVHLPLDENAAPVFNPSERAYHQQPAPKKDEPPIEIGFKEGSPRFVASPVGQGVAFDGKLFFDGGIHADYRYKTTSSDYRERFTMAAWVYPENEQSGSIITKVSDSPAEIENGVPRAEGYGLYFLNGKIHFNMVFRWGEDALRVETENTLPLKRWQHVAVVFDGLQQWEARLRIFVDGVEQKLKFNQRNFYLLFGGSKNTLKIGAGGGAQFRFKGALDEVRMFSRALEADEIAALACSDALATIAVLPARQRTPAQAYKLQRAFLQQAAPNELKQSFEQLRMLRQQRQNFVDYLPTLMVMEELPQPRPTFLLRRGAYDLPGEKVERGVPAVLPPLRFGKNANHLAPQSNRLDFARWLVSAEHPLTARVAVNRFWQMLFGAGLVKTSEDFGSQGELPSHPELLDWLAIEFATGRQGDGAMGRKGDAATRRHGDTATTRNGQRATGNGQNHNPQSASSLPQALRNPQSTAWNIKALLRLIVTSATYRQASQLSESSRQRDPDNRLLSRGARFRMSAEMIRDQALFVSGLLVEKIGGASVKPYQPDGLYKDMAFGGLTGYQHERGDGLWRRSLYTFWKRTVLAPTMQVFDASAREFCTVRDTRTNTPLQSLNLMNDVTYIEAARMLAERMILHGGADAAQRLAWGFRVVLSRSPGAREMQMMMRSLSVQQMYFNQQPQEATRLLSVGERRNDPRLKVTELAAYTSVASLLLNLDEAITKQ